MNLAIWPGRLSLTFLVLFTSWLVYVTAYPIGRPTFFSDPVHALLLLGAVAAAVAGGALGVVAIVARVWSVGTFISILLGTVVLWWTIAELRGH